MTPGLLARRIVLRLDPAQPRDAAMEIAVHLAKAFDAELAARMILDTRLAAALAVRHGESHAMETSLRRAELSFRQTISTIAAREHAQWSFEVVHCAGVLSHECVMEAGDLVAIDLPRMEFSLTELREEITEALALARGVLLFPEAARPTKGPVAVIASTPAGADALRDEAAALAGALATTVKTMTLGSDHRDVADIATAVRRLGPTLAIIAARDPLAEAFLARPRHLRELAAPLLLLNAAQL
jgi:hypothetical protein